MKKLILVYNPVAGEAIFKYQLDTLIEKFLVYDCIIIPFRTTKDNLPLLARLFEHVAADGVLIAGGDGTVHQIINLLLQGGLDVPLGIIPSGTCNDFASYLGLGRDLDSYIAGIAAGRVMPVDVGTINDKFFLNVASAGLLTSVAHTVDSTLKNVLGKIAYYLKGLGELPNFRSFQVRIEADGKVIEDEIFLFLVLNGGTVGSFSNFIQAQVDDGKLDLVIIKKCRIPELMSLVLGLLSGNDITRHASVIHVQAKQLCISSAEQIESDVDGELGPQLPLAIDALPGRIKLFC